MSNYDATRIPVPGDQGALLIGPIPGDERAVDSILTSNIGAVLTLATEAELEAYGVPHMRDIFLRNALSWTHFPIRDFDVPDIAATETWFAIETILVERLKAGGEILIHCRAGFGRSGMIAARLLLACGSSADDAVAIVRAARPGTIETPAQLAWATGADVGDAA